MPIVSILFLTFISNARAVASEAATGSELHPSVASEPSLSLKAAIARALERNNAILEAREKVEQAREDRLATRSVVFPTVNLSLTAADAKSPTGNLGQAPFGGRDYQTYTSAFTLTQPLLQFGVLSGIHAADDTIQMNALDLEVAERTLTNSVIQSFYGVALNRLLLDDLEKILKVVQESLQTAEARLRTGRGQLLDVLTVKTQVALLVPQIESARNNLESVGAQLANYMADNGKYYLNVDAKLKGLHLAEVEPRLHPGARRLPELIKFQLQRDQLESQKWVSLGQHLPSLNLTGSLGSQSFNRMDYTSASRRDWSIGVTLTIPIFSGLSSVYQQRSLAAQEREIVFGEHDLRNSLELQKIQSRKTLESTESSLVSAVEAAKLAEASMNEARRQYRLATIDFMQFLTIEQSLVQADSSLYNTQYNNLVAFANWFVALGEPLGTLVDLL